MSPRRLTLILLQLAIASTALADPCGMVPPIYPGKQVPLARVGEQRTYVFYKDGVESFVIRPGFTGKVEEFGMLIPFPTPPAIRKISDQVFEHVTAAVDPPEVVVNCRIDELMLANSAPQASQSLKNQSGLNLTLEKQQVVVLREEAVGMYEVAVLAAGSASALNKWMEDHGYKYPAGMDKPCNDYVEAGWCFVALKTKVAAKTGVDAKPGQRSTDSNLPSGASFDGYVQAMGFRFESDELVVPMRLSAFNQGDLRNIVYLLSDSPKKIRSIPEEYVVRQATGSQLITNMMDPLPLRIIGGTEANIPEYRRRTLPAERNPAPHNGVAKELFAADLLAVESKQLALPVEEREKALLNIGERLGLRGNDIDQVNSRAITGERNRNTDEGLKLLAPMTLTVIDGDFPREVLAKTNLTFGEYKMPARQNQAENYNARTKSPQPALPGVLHQGSIDWSQHDQQQGGVGRVSAMALLVSIGLGLAVFGLFCIRRK